jgi:hypothetical protein
VQRIRIPENQIRAGDDRIAHHLYQTLSDEKIADAPW